MNQGSHHNYTDLIVQDRRSSDSSGFHALDFPRSSASRDMERFVLWDATGTEDGGRSVLLSREDTGLWSQKAVSLETSTRLDGKAST